jgi:Dimethlysulfonioproprionate lyase
MPHRSEMLQSFVDTAAAAFDQLVKAPEARRAIVQIFSALKAAGAERSAAGSRLPVCSHLQRALEIDTSHLILRRLVERFKSIEPLLEWRRRATSNSSASDNFADGHANAMIIGPGGLEERQDVWLGATVMAPKVRYPDHNHAPEEVYLVLSEGEFRQGEGAWFSPGLGGTLYNPHGIKHAMRSLDTPLFAFWALRA